MKFSAGPASFYETALFDPISALVSGGVSLVGGLLGSNSAKSAASTQANAASQAAALQQEQYQQTRADLAPYRGYGQTGGDQLINQLGYVTAPFNPTQTTLEDTPGYRFIRDQGLQSVQNSAAAKGLGISGAALKGAADYSTGLAQKTYKTLFDIDQGNKGATFNRLMALTSSGANAASQTGQFGAQSAQNAGQFSTSGAAAEAAGDIGGANALAKGLGGIGSAASTYALFSNPEALNRLAAINTGPRYS